MISIPLITFLIIYCLFLLLFAIFFFINAGYLAKTASISFASLAITFFVLAFALITVGATLYFLSDANWGGQITVFNSDWFGDSMSQINQF
jgi:hypothetical protein